MLTEYRNPGSTEDSEDPADYTEPGICLAGGAGLGQRLDRFLTDALQEKLPGLSRSRVQHWIQLGAVRVNGRPATSAQRLLARDAVAVWPQPLEADHAFEPCPMALDVVFEDNDLLVVYKPVGLVVHPAPGHWRATLMNGLLHARPGLARLPRAGIVHRLDRDTSGLLIVAKHAISMSLLQEQLARRAIHRVYLALVHGCAQALHQVTIHAPIGRDPVSRVRMACAGLAAREATTHVAHLATLAGGHLCASADLPPGPVADRYAPHRFPPVSLLSCKLASGRTHQIRVHLASRGYPLLGDPLYGAPGADALLRQARPSWAEFLCRGQALHAALLVWDHPCTGRRLEIYRDWQLPAQFAPPDALRLCSLWGLRGNPPASDAL